jgi:hypothetical protein
MPRPKCCFLKQRTFNELDSTIDDNDVCCIEEQLQENAKDEFTLGNVKKQYAPDVQIEPKNLDISVDIDLLNKTANFSVVITVVNRTTKTRTLHLNAVGRFFVFFIGFLILFFLSFFC